MYDINKVRKDFPILARKIYGRPLVYLDNAATTQKPLCVLDAMREEYLNVNANVHRGVHWMSQQATELHEDCSGDHTPVYQCQVCFGDRVYQRDH
jgi:cysteine desulfurase/selenocysteine lyase